MAKAAEVVLQLRAENAQYLARLRQSEAQFAKSLGNIQRQAGAAAAFLGTSLGGIGAALSVREIATYADAWTEAGNMVRAAATSAGVSARSLNDLKDEANSARTDLGAYVDLYARLIRSASGVAKSEQEIADATNIVAKAFKAGGASASEQAAGILQLGQALGSGVLQGDELRSLRENAPILAQAIADEFKTTIAGLKQLGAEGKLTSDRVFRAIINAQKPIEEQFRSTNATIRDAITQVNNEFTAYIGNADASAGASRQLVEALQFLATNFKEVGDTVIQFATILIGALTGRALAGVVVGLGNAVVALGSFLTALRAGTVAAGSFTAALGPIGLLAGAAAAAIYVLSRSQDQAERAAGTFRKAVADNETALKNTTDATYAQVDALRQLIAAQAQAARAAATQANADFDTAIGRRDAFRGATGGYDFAPFTYAVDVADRRAAALDLAAGKLEEQLAATEKLLSTKPSGFGGGNGAAGDGDGKSGKANAFEREIRQIRERTAALQAETVARAGLNPLINDYGFALEKARAVAELENAALQAKVALTPEVKSKIDELANGYANAVVQAEMLAESQEQVRDHMEEMADLGRDVFGGFINDMMAGQTAAEALAGALSKVGDKLLDIAMNSLFGGGGGDFGILGSLLGIGGGFGTKTGFMDMLTGRATGGPVTKGQPYIVGEKRPELFIPNQSGRIIPSVPKLSAPAGPGGAGGIVVNFSPVIDNRGASVEAVARNERQLAKMKAELPALVVQAVRSANSKNVKFA